MIVPPRKQTKTVVQEEDAELLSRPVGRGSALAPPPISDLDDDEDGDDYDDDDGVDRAIAGLNDPSVEQLGPSPRLGGTVGGGRPSDLFGQDAYTMGRATSPRLYSQASQFPTCAQLRVWRWENGIPVGLGAIDAMAAEEDFVREFFEAMPKPGQGRMQFKLRPIDVRGEEMGKEITLVISEHHAALQQIRRAKKAESEENTNNGGPMYGQGGTVVVDRGDGDAGAAYASEMSRMFEKAVEAADQRTNALEQALLEERERLRTDDGQRAQERIDLATQAAQGVQAITERMMRDESSRAERAMRSQSDQSQMLLTTLTQIFASAQSQQHSISETARAADHQRLEQERQYAERVRMEQEDRRKRDIQEMEERRKMEQARLEEERHQLRQQRDFEIKQLELRAERDRLELHAKAEREKAEALVRQALEERRLEKDRLEGEARIARLRDEEERKGSVERSEIERRVERERLEWEHRWKLEAEERDRRDRSAREERERLASLETERRRMDAEERERRERSDRDERERRERDNERRALLEAEATRGREAERLRAHDVGLKQMEMAAARDREHSERMLQMSRMELDSQRQANDIRMAREREEGERREQERIRQHERMVKEAELQSQKDREHAERMMQLTQMQMRGDSFGGLAEMIPKAKELLSTLGIDPSDLIDRFMNPPEPAAAADTGGSGWADAVPKMLGALAEVGKAAFEAQAAKKTPQIPQQPIMVMPPGMMQGYAGVPANYPGMQMAQPGAPLGAPMPGMQGVPSFTTPGGPEQKALADTQLFDNEPPAEGEQEAEAMETEQNEEAAQGEQAVEDRAANQAERLMEAATDAGLTMMTQKKARKAIRGLVRKLSTAKEPEWFGIIAGAIQNEISIYHYVKAITVKAALLEAGADEELSIRVVEAMRKSGMIPDDVPFEEGDKG